MKQQIKDHWWSRISGALAIACAVSAPAFAESLPPQKTGTIANQTNASVAASAVQSEPLMPTQTVPTVPLIVNPHTQNAPLLPEIPPPKSLRRVTSVSQLSDAQSADWAFQAIQPLGQMTSVTQLSDVQPTDWAFQAVQSLVEKYGCVVGYPDGTLRGNRAVTRFELAAALNACLDVFSDRFATKEDLETARKLQEQFSAELTTLRGRVDSMEARTAQLEAQHFSTTTKLLGVTNMWFAGATGTGFSSNNPLAQAAFNNNNPVVQYRVNLNLLTSFTGKDLLATSLFAGNVPPLGTGFNLPGEIVNGIPIASAEGTLSTQFAANSNNQLYMAILRYSFPVTQKLRVDAVSNIGTLFSIAPVLNPYLADSFAGTGALSAFGQGNAISALGGGTGIGLNFQATPQVDITAAYLSDFLSAPNPNKGFINGGYAALGQVTWRPTQQLGFAATYVHSYFLPGRFGFNYNALNITGTAVANTLAGQSRLTEFPELFNLGGVRVDSYGGQFTYQFSPKFTLSAWFGASYPTLIGQGNGEIFNYALTFAFPDMGRKGNLLGLVLGAEPYLNRFTGGNPQPFNVDVPLHLEAFYKYQVNDGISVTPGFIILTAPNQDNNNPAVLIGNIRTTFTF
ncbi:iron uptake porin [Candidatus Synechococcus calcipolaris G9]|uniref:Iron uptake porin n=1 Tax=Candidatus Synechococcus calcipolaris G9 TaxID=1497997 RepID=A0ABT6EYF4_9SYNE|nr:iron uptake porin [Candidatus Synechococcus calcipolaris]MDG2990824.1 iron uptake porin [Candidatus Synechococcus calcipolaris G9]